MLWLKLASIVIVNPSLYPPLCLCPTHNADTWADMRSERHAMSLHWNFVTF